MRYKWLIPLFLGGCSLVTLKPRETLKQAPLCPIGYTALTNPLGFANNTFGLDGQRVSDGAHQLWCAPVSAVTSPLITFATADRNGPAQCSNIGMTITTPDHTTKSSQGTNNTLRLPPTPGTYLIDILGDSLSSCNGGSTYMVYYQSVLLGAGPTPSPLPSNPGVTPHPTSTPNPACTCSCNQPTPEPTGQPSNPCEAGVPGWCWNRPNCGIIGTGCTCSQANCSTSTPTPQPTSTPSATSAAPIDLWFDYACIGKQAYAGAVPSLVSSCQGHQWWNADISSANSSVATNVANIKQTITSSGMIPYGVYVGEWGSGYGAMPDSRASDEISQLKGLGISRFVAAVYTWDTTGTQTTWVHDLANLNQFLQIAKSVGITDVTWEISNAEVPVPYPMPQRVTIASDAGKAIRAAGLHADIQIEFANGADYNTGWFDCSLLRLANSAGFDTYSGWSAALYQKVASAVDSCVANLPVFTPMPTPQPTPTPQPMPTPVPTPTCPWWHHNCHG